MLKIKTNSKLVEPGDTFVAIKGNTVDGHQYIEEAINKGARFIVAEHGEYKVPTLIVKDTTEYLRETLSKDYSKEKYPSRTALVLGSEGNGIRKKVKETCDVLIKIPMYGKINSLNVSVAGGIILSEIVKSFN